jgi:hypothetical protein
MHSFWLRLFYMPSAMQSKTQHCQQKFCSAEREAEEEYKVP